MKRVHTRGLTLIELVIVVAILGALAAMLLPKFDGLQSAANHASTASSCNDLARLLVVYKTTKTVFPDGWDSLMDGTALWDGTATSTSPAGANVTQGGNAGTFVKGLHPELVTSTTVTNPDTTTTTTSTAKLKTTTLTADQVAAFAKVGITTLFNVTTSSTLRPATCSRRR